MARPLGICLAHWRAWVQSPPPLKNNVGKGRKLRPFCTMGGRGLVTLENTVSFKMLGGKSPRGPTILLRDTGGQQKTPHTDALRNFFSNVRKVKATVCPSADKMANSRSYICAVEHLLAQSAPVWTVLRGVLLNKTSHKKSHVLCCGSRS